MSWKPGSHNSDAMVLHERDARAHIMRLYQRI